MTTASLPPSHVPQFMSCVSQTMNFADRMSNFLMKSFNNLIMLYHTWYTDRVLGRIFPKGDMPSTWQLISDVNGMLINTNNVLDYPRLQPQTFINVGGMQISDKPKALPEVS